MLMLDESTLATDDALKAVVTPEPTDSWRPVGHLEARDMILGACERRGLEIASAETALSPEGTRAMGEVRFRNLDMGDLDFVGVWRNSIDKSLPLGFAIGTHCYVCDNGCIHGELVSRHKHTSRVIDGMGQRLDEALGRFLDKRVDINRRVEIWSETELTDAQMALAIMESVQAGGLPSRRAGLVWDEWQEPSFPEFKERNVWSGFNAFTHVAKGHRAEDHRRTEALGKVDATFSRLFPVASLN